MQSHIAASGWEAGHDQSGGSTNESSCCAESIALRSAIGIQEVQLKHSLGETRESIYFESGSRRASLTPGIVWFLCFSPTGQRSPSSAPESADWSAATSSNNIRVAVSEHSCNSVGPFDGEDRLDAPCRRQSVRRESKRSPGWSSISGRS